MLCQEITERRGHILKECMKFLEKQDGQILKLLLQKLDQVLSKQSYLILFVQMMVKKKRCNKRKIEAVLDDYISDKKEERAGKEKKKQAKEAWLKELEKQRERQHKEK
ncbi:uncharacterized protein LOC105186630 [Harpegnathos saltator]|uniref:uncharacterized protein LOC105186630 n=1 Tax=Harpegnathos saltator TaxID=610380 RepID=UPI00058E44D6|nr:uncharacterized protein LOC105186630 [Harpegnathos saltator]XP_011145308.1 uncharacterized protein LOC105186630 [Harpegnathos saltator]